MSALLKILRRNKDESPESFNTRRGIKETKDGLPLEEDFPATEVQYLGSVLVEELKDGASYGERLGENAVKTVVAMSKAKGGKLPYVLVRMTPAGIVVRDKLEGNIIVQTSIYRIHYCTSDRNHQRVFAYIARNTDNETMECYAFHCAKPRIALSLAITMAQIFQAAKQEEDEKKALRTFTPTPTSSEKSDVPSPTTSADSSICAENGWSTQVLKQSPPPQLASP